MSGARQAAITVVGLGSGDESQLTLGIWNKLNGAGSSDVSIRMRTDQHPVVQALRERGVVMESFDDIYETESSFDQVYERIAERLMEEALSEGKEIVYAVPGHPMVAEATVQLLRERCEKRGVSLQVLGGESFLDQTFVRLGLDPIEGFTLLDGTSLKSDTINPRVHTIVAQVYDQLTASEVKLTLMEKFPDDYMVVVGHALGVAGQERIDRVPLYELDRLSGYGNLSLVWIPKAEDELDRVHNRSFEQLHRIVETLRSPGGCPWDIEQTHSSIRNNLIEETYEVLETIDDDDPQGMREELGDLMLQVMLHSQMEAEEGTFTVYDVIESLNEKLIRRHPHVFGERQASDAGEALQNWQSIKDEEKRAKGIDPEEQSVLSGIPRDLPGVMTAWRLQKKAAKVGFDWERIEDVYAKIQEELVELQEAGHDHESVSNELGDVLFAVVNLARFLKVDPEEAVSLTNRKFIRRFRYMEEQLRLNGKQIDQTDIQELENLWQQAKNFE
jgi:tetrapyrrole methylase family protein / MazG family protein